MLLKVFLYQQRKNTTKQRKLSKLVSNKRQTKVYGTSLPLGSNVDELFGSLLGKANDGNVVQ
jgi:hypothetical protein